jgi:hypothetical protein
MGGTGEQVAVLDMRGPKIGVDKKGLLSINKLKDQVKVTAKQTFRPDQSRFEGWDTNVLRELLVFNDVEVRGANRAPHKFIVSVCDEVFKDQPMPAPPPSRTFKEMVALDRAALHIQKSYFKRKAAEIEAAYQRAHVQENRRLAAGIEPDMHDFHQQTTQSGRRTSVSNHQERAEASMMSRDHAHTKGNVTEQNRKQLQDEVKIEWHQPSLKYAHHFYKMNHPHHAGSEMRPYDYRDSTLGRHCVIGGCGEQLDLWDEGQVSEFGQFGSGITNYFKFLKWCCWVYFMLALINTPAIVMNILGVGNQYGEGFSLAVTTVGNLGDSFNVTDVFIPGCDESDFQQPTCTIPKSDLANYYAYMDLLGTTFVLLAWLWLRNFEKKEVLALDRSTVTASDYTVRVPWVPKDTKEIELRAHFSRVTNKAVVDVCLAYDNSAEIELYFERGKLMKKRFDVVHKLRYWYTTMKKHGDSVGDPDEIRYLEKERETITTRIKELDTKRAIEVKGFPSAIQAFVTFDDEEGMVLACKAYSLSWWKNLCYPKMLRFKGHKIKCKVAPEPSTILWENLEYSNFERWRRKTTTTLIAGAMIFFSVIFTFFARDVQQSALDKGGDEECPEVWGRMDEAEKLSMVQRDDKVGILHCYCDEFDTLEQFNGAGGVCKDYVKAQLTASGTAMGAAMSVVVINYAFTVLMNKFAMWEKHQSMDSMEGSVTSRTFILKFINTGCLILLYNQEIIKRATGINLDVDADFSVSWYATGGSQLIIVMLGTIISPHIAPIMRYRSGIAKMVRVNENEDLLRGETEEVEFFTQDSLNTAFLGPEFHMDLRYAQLLVNFFICFMYMTGMPILTWIGFLCFFTQYWVDKFLFCNFYRTPPQYSDTMGKMSTNYIGFSIIVHLLLSIWMLGNRAIFESQDFNDEQEIKSFESSYNPLKVHNNLQQEHVVPLAGFLIVFVTLWFVNVQTKEFTHFTKQFINCITCGTGGRHEKLVGAMNTVSVSYTRARERGLIKGLASYNILQNPKYQEAFSIDAKFASEHKHVTSIRKLAVNGAAPPPGALRREQEENDML